ncbi:excalibur calcium-binding domain-containing protein [Octadecabacter sp. R77987]|uniref:excalibur calcium-binding domain-containing protein n=1 Tax=Octadecabacter sp. R77987 TaxID=3093874 RepID=UPI0036724539
MRAFAVISLVLAGTVGAAEGIAPPRVTLDHPLFANLRNVQAFNCSNTTCTQIRSCEEACYKLRVCGHTRRDGDGDGIPCENLCSRRCP